MTKDQEKTENFSSRNIISHKKLLISAKYLFLTYARCPENWNMEFVRDKLLDEILIYEKKDKKNQTKVKSYIISEEKHQDPIGKGKYERGKHYHCLIELKDKIKIYKNDYLDIEGIHGNYQSAKEIRSVINYIKKNGKWIGKGFPGMANKEREILEAKTEQDAKLILMKKMSPENQIKLRREIITTIKKETIVKEIAMNAPDYPYQEVLKPYERFKGQAGFNAKGRPIGLLIYGEAESGKTTGTYKMAAELGTEVIVVDDLKEMKEHYKGEEIILLDEMKKEVFEKYSSEIANFVTNPTAKTVSYYGSIELVWPRKIVIATNENIKKWKWTEGLKSRFLIIKAMNDGRYIYQMWKENELENMTDEKVKNKLGTIKIF